MALPKLEGRLTVPSGGWSLTVSAATSITSTITSGTYYLTTSGSPGYGLLTAVVNQLNTDHAAADFNISLDDNSDTSTGKVTLNKDTATFAITAWGSTGLRDALGFTATTSGASTVTGGEQAEYLWLPPVGRAAPMAPEPTSATSNFGARETDHTFAMSPSGVSKRLTYNTRYLDNLEFRLVLANKMWLVHESTANESFEKFYTDVIGNGYPIRYHSSRDSDTLFWTLVVENAELFQPRPQAEAWTGSKSLWDIAYMVRKLV